MNFERSTNVVYCNINNKYCLGVDNRQYNDLIMNVYRRYPLCSDSIDVYNSTHVVQCIDSMYNLLVHSLAYAASSTIPIESCNFRKYWWNIEVEQLKQESIASHIAWTNASRPKHGDVFNRKVNVNLPTKAASKII